MKDPRARPTSRLYEIDLLRILAALAVVFFHYTFSGYLQGTSPVAFSALGQFSRYGYLGVDMFFTISGFVVLLSAWERRPHEFVISRIVRLYPAYLVAVTITAVVALTLSRGLFHVSAPQYLANLTMFNMPLGIPGIDVVYWTLWAEMRFYLIIFILLSIGISQRRVTVLIWLWLATTFLLESGLLPASPRNAVDTIVQSDFSHYFIAGMALATMYRFGHSWWLSTAVVVAFGNAVYRSLGFGHDVGQRYRAEIHPVVVIGVVTMIFCVLTLVALRVTQRLARPWFVFVGALTYPLYLVHAHVGFVIFSRVDRSVNRYVLLVATIAAMCLVAYLIHRCVERPFAPRLKRSLVGVSDRLASRFGAPQPDAFHLGTPQPDPSHFGTPQPDASHFFGTPQPDPSHFGTPQPVVLPLPRQDEQQRASDAASEQTWAGQPTRELFKHDG